MSQSKEQMVLDGEDGKNVAGIFASSSSSAAAPWMISTPFASRRLRRRSLCRCFFAHEEYLGTRVDVLEGIKALRKI
jgi:hypothetical protein